MSAPWCPQCGSDMHKKRSGSGWYWWCDKCQCGEEEYDDEGIDYEDRLSAEDAADIWMSSGQDEDYTFGYSEEELRNTL